MGGKHINTSSNGVYITTHYKVILGHPYQGVLMKLKKIHCKPKLTVYRHPLFAISSTDRKERRYTQTVYPTYEDILRNWAQKANRFYTPQSSGIESK